jgi:hypothetical protein
MGGGKKSKLAKSFKSITHKDKKSHKKSVKSSDHHDYCNNNREYMDSLRNLQQRMNGPKKVKRQGVIELKAATFKIEERKTILPINEDDFQFTADSLLKDEHHIVSSVNQQRQQPSNSKPNKKSPNTYNNFSLLETDEDETKTLHLQPSILASNTFTALSDSDDDAL